MGADRLRAMFDAARAGDRAVFMPFLTAGLPDPSTSPALFRALAEGGADAFEVGIPYSDPLMDGPVIHAASTEALRAGTTLGGALSIISEVAAGTGKPVLAMGYANPIQRLGPVPFARRLAEAGADGLIVADVSFEEALPLKAAVESAGLGMALFAAPTTGDDRLARMVAAEPAFVYCVAAMGVTGERTGRAERAAALAGRVRALTDLPLVLGVGISTPEQAAEAARHADGVIVGSALVRMVLEQGSGAAAGLRQAAGLFSAAIATARTGP